MAESNKNCSNFSISLFDSPKNGLAAMENDILDGWLGWCGRKQMNSAGEKRGVKGGKNAFIQKYIFY